VRSVNEAVMSGSPCAIPINVSGVERPGRAVRFVVHGGSIHLGRHWVCSLVDARSGAHVPTMFQLAPLAMAIVVIWSSVVASAARMVR
jgi:hypothetical protein